MFFKKIIVVLLQHPNFSSNTTNLKTISFSLRQERKKSLNEVIDILLSICGPNKFRYIQDKILTTNQIKNNNKHIVLKVTINFSLFNSQTLLTLGFVKIKIPLFSKKKTILCTTFYDHLQK